MRSELYALHFGQRKRRSLWVASRGWSVTDSGEARQRGQRTWAPGSVERIFAALIQRLVSSFIVVAANDAAGTRRCGWPGESADVRAHP